jgi:phospholipase C
MQYWNRVALISLLVLPGIMRASEIPKGLKAVENIVVIYLENHSFDNLYGFYPGAEGISNAPKEKVLQVDAEGKPYPSLPPVIDTLKKPHEPDVRFPKDLPNEPFPIERYVPIRERTGDLTHRFYQHQQQINGGKMNRFAEVSDAKGLVMGYYDGTQLPLWSYARRYTLADHFFAAAFGGSFLNHMWLSCACTPYQPHPPASNTIELNARGELIKDGAFTPDGYAVNNVLSASAPRSPKADQADRLLIPQEQPTIGDRLSEKGIDWAWYAGGWTDALAGHPDPTFQFHHQPYVYFSRYAEGTEARQNHLKDSADFEAAIENGDLPPVAFYKPLGRLNEHPGDTDLLEGEEHVAALLKKLEASPQWPHMVVIVTYDEHGGYWDHVAPPKGDRFGPGSRIPAVIVSPFTLGGRIDSTIYDTTSILKLIEERFGLDPLGERDRKAHSLAKALKLGG